MDPRALGEPAVAAVWLAVAAQVAVLAVHWDAPWYLMAAGALLLSVFAGALGDACRRVGMSWWHTTVAFYVSAGLVAAVGSVLADPAPALVVALLYPSGRMFWGGVSAVARIASRSRGSARDTSAGGR